MKSHNQLWNFFASVKLAIFTLCIIAVTSIIGTIIPQRESFSFYVSKYGDTMARFFHVLDIPDMYGSWWFLGLLGILCANLIICSVDRFPFVWKQITADPLAVSTGKLERMPFTHRFSSSSGMADIAGKMELQLKDNGWQAKVNSSDKGTILAAQKGAWTRTGVYIVHLSILVIFFGSAIGTLFGFKGSVMLPETKKTDKVYSSETSAMQPLGFEVRCDLFEIEFYDNGMPKEYRSRLTVLENDEIMLVKDIEVNDPLHYRGYTFYQSSYEGYKDFVITINNQTDKQSNTFVAPFQQQVEWQETPIHFGIVNAEAIRDRVVRVKFWFKNGENPPETFWMDANSETQLEQNGKTYLISAKQMYATGLQVAKDPGVWLVYLGCGLMMLGLYLAFFMSHQRVWIWVTPGDNGTSLLLAGTANKNRIGFEKTFTKLTTKFSDTI